MVAHSSETENDGNNSRVFLLFFSQLHINQVSQELWFFAGRVWVSFALATNCSFLLGREVPGTQVRRGRIYRKIKKKPDTGLLFLQPKLAVAKLRLSPWIPPSSPSPLRPPRRPHASRLRPRSIIVADRRRSLLLLRRSNQSEVPSRPRAALTHHPRHAD